MKLAYKLVGYDRETEDLVEKHLVPPKHVDFAKKVAGITADNEGAGDTPLTASQARDIAGTIGAEIQADHRDYFLEPYVERVQHKHPAHA